LNSLLIWRSLVTGTKNKIIMKHTLKTVKHEMKRLGNRENCTMRIFIVFNSSDFVKVINFRRLIWETHGINKKIKTKIWLKNLMGAEYLQELDLLIDIWMV
jgi:hypothetical protein